MLTVKLMVCFFTTTTTNHAKKYSAFISERIPATMSGITVG